jgi:hypothetical protein
MRQDENLYPHLHKVLLSGYLLDEIRLLCSTEHCTGGANTRMDAAHIIRSR